MPRSEQRTFTLGPEQVRYIDRLVADGKFETASEVVQAGRVALQQRDAARQWLHREIVPVAAAMEADPSRAISAEHVFAGLREMIGRKRD